MANYNALVDKRARITFSANQQTGNPQIDVKMIPNTKIASNRIEEEREKKRLKRCNNIEGQMMSLTEMIGYILNQQTVFCSESFIVQALFFLIGFRFIYFFIFVRWVPYVYRDAPTLLNNFRH